MKNNFVKTNLRWAGGKSKMLKILDNYFPEKVDKYLEPFTGGGSVLLYIIQKYNPKNVISNDIDEKLINYYIELKYNVKNIVDECLEIKNRYDKDSFREKFYELNRKRASDFFISNKTSFSGLNKTYSRLAFDRNFSINSINKLFDISKLLNNVTFVNYDLAIFDQVFSFKDFFIYLDPPYYGNKDKGLYGENGELHKKFNHELLKKFVNENSLNNKIMISYDDSPYIRELYKDYNIHSFDFKYSMTNVGGNKCKTGNELVITNY